MLECPSRLVNSARFHPDNCCVASGNSDHCIQVPRTASRFFQSFGRFRHLSHFHYHVSGYTWSSLIETMSNTTVVASDSSWYPNSINKELLKCHTFHWLRILYWQQKAKLNFCSSVLINRHVIYGSWIIVRCGMSEASTWFNITPQMQEQLILCASTLQEITSSLVAMMQPWRWFWAHFILQFHEYIEIRNEN